MAPARLRLTLAVAAALAASPALGACDDPAWDLAAVAALIAAPAPAGATGDRGVANAVAVPLAPQAEVDLELPPERPPRSADPQAGMVRFGPGAAGTYRFALSQAAWIDVVQDGAHVPSGDFVGLHDCPAVRKIVAFDIGAGPFTLQLSDAEAASIAVAILPVR